MVDLAEERGDRPREDRALLKAVQELLGDSTIEMTMRYSHLSPTCEVRRAAA